MPQITPSWFAANDSHHDRPGARAPMGVNPGPAFPVTGVVASRTNSDAWLRPQRELVLPAGEGGAPWFAP
ncbi:hypothetical protein GCM10010201_08670 [Pilimelia columellifera subsp. columellifera]|uniref:Uncharacterized protein n=1 Tax=Pilimelia columellifera subsp. columellifera TaxID=706583 RepID=A0ABP6ACT5_9ACTN